MARNFQLRTSRPTSNRPNARSGVRRLAPPSRARVAWDTRTAEIRAARRNDRKVGHLSSRPREPLDGSPARGRSDGRSAHAPGQGHEGLLEPGPGDLEVTERDAASDQVADGGVGVQGVDRDARTADVDLRDAVEIGEHARSGRSVTKRSRRVATAALRVAPGPSATTLPWLSTTTRSAISSASARWWVANRTVRPSFPKSRIICQKPWRDSTSMAEVGSSRKTSSGSPAMAMAKRTRWAWPPDRRWVRRRRSARCPTRSTIWSRRRPAVEAPDQAEGLVDARRGETDAGAGLEHRAHSAVGDGPAWVAAENLDPAFLRSEETEKR